MTVSLQYICRILANDYYDSSLYIDFLEYLLVCGRGRLISYTCGSITTCEGGIYVYLKTNEMQFSKTLFFFEEDIKKEIFRLKMEAL